MQFGAQTTKPTPINLVNHNYWNFSGADSGRTIDDHILQIAGNFFTVCDEESIPTGEIASVAMHPELDFTTPKAVGRDLPAVASSPQRGYDHCFMLRHPQLSAAAKKDHRQVTYPGREAVVVVSPVTGIRVEIFTTYPGMQLYTGNYLGPPYPFSLRQALCLEAQYFANSPNVAHFPSTVLEPGDEYYHVQVYRFSVAEPSTD
jgi:aldose 1-epimerase